MRRATVETNVKEQPMTMHDNGSREVVIVAAVRTAIGRGHPEKGIYRDLHPSNLLAHAYGAVIERAGIDPAEVGNVFAGCVQQIGEQSLNIARDAWLEAGLPMEVPANTLDTQCGSGQQAVNVAAGLIAAGVHDVAVGAGVEHMGHISFAAVAESNERYGSPITPQLAARYDLVNQGLAAEMIADRWEIGRAELDEIGLRSQQLARRATDEGRFQSEIAPIRTADGLQTIDQGLRETTTEGLAALRPAFKEDGKITAGNSSQISDGAAAVILMAREKAAALGLEPRARLVDQTTVGVDPVTMLTGPIPATRELFTRNGIGAGDVDRFEVNEAFASVVAAWSREIEPDLERVNVNGGAIALGHPLGASGARLIATLLHELERSDTELGLVTMCCGGGLGTGTLIQRI
ncbi:MAG TPA: thiolase family protein [Solirubrobacterales bacterium]|nr:thiolase family protein [Solirubrobacterales bacterium]